MKNLKALDLQSILAMILFVIASSTFTGCGSGSGAGGGGGSAGGGTTPVADVVYQYTYQEIGTGGSFNAVVRSNFGDMDQQEQPISSANIPASGLDGSIYGRTLHISFVNNGAVTITVNIYRSAPPYTNAVLMQSVPVYIGQNVNIMDNL